MTIAKRRGRPRLDPHSSLPSTEVSVSLPATTYAIARRIAKHERMSVQDVIRYTLRGTLQRIIIDRDAGTS